MIKKIIHSVLIIASVFSITAFVNIKNNQTYPEVKIGDQVWMRENLNVEKFSNGDPIPQAKSNEEWEKYCSDEKPAWCYYDNDPSNGIQYGKLYNGYAVIDTRGLAPNGWHIPSHEEWEKLGKYLGTEKAGEKLKSEKGWKVGEATNTTGFSAFPAGFRYLTGEFMQLEIDTYFWSSIDVNEEKFKEANIHYLTETNSELTWNRDTWCSGFSVRCVKN
jgi:uncharacterized protein (TIGR02145 family)